MPEEFTRRLKCLWGERFEEGLERLCSDRPLTFRICAGFEEDGVVSALLEDKRFGCERWRPELAVYRVRNEMRNELTRHEALAVDAPKVYIQDLASMLAPWSLMVSPGLEVLDLAAAPGGKTLLLGEAMKGEGRLAAVEVIKGRFHRLRSNLKAHGMEWVKTYLADGRTVGRKTPGRFDRVLLDAPCSSEARMDGREAETCAHWSLRKLRETSRKQKGLLVSALQAVKPGGLVLYSTCSFAPEENEAVVAHALQADPEWLGGEVELVEMTLPWWDGGPPCGRGLRVWEGREYGDGLAMTRRIFPDDWMSGFYLALLRKRI